MNAKRLVSDDEQVDLIRASVAAYQTGSDPTIKEFELYKALAIIVRGYEAMNEIAISDRSDHFNDPVPVPHGLLCAMAEVFKQRRVRAKAQTAGRQRNAKSIWGPIRQRAKSIWATHPSFNVMDVARQIQTRLREQPKAASRPKKVPALTTIRIEIADLRPRSVTNDR